jgi:hypothetical protein
MNAKELIELIRLQVERIKTDGGTLVTIASLEDLLSAAENAAEDGGFAAAAAIKHADLLHQSNLATYNAQAASGRELFKSVIEMAKIAVNSLILINGSSAVALLAFIGHLASANNPRIPISSFRHTAALLCNRTFRRSFLWVLNLTNAETLRRALASMRNACELDKRVRWLRLFGCLWPW